MAKGQRRSNHEPKPLKQPVRGTDLSGGPAPATRDAANPSFGAMRVGGRVALAHSRKQHAAVSPSGLAEQRIAEAAKTARLRSLRLAREAEDRERAAQSAIVAPIKSPRIPRGANSGPRSGPASGRE